MSRRLTVDDLIADVRSLLDEDNTANISDDTDILPALNRAQDVAANILARHYETPLIVSKTVTPTANQQEFDIPEDALEERLEKVEIQVGEFYHEVPRVSYRDISQYDYVTTAAIPQAHAIVGNKYRLLPSVTGIHPLRIWYSKDPEPFVKCQGRITVINTGSNYVTLNDIPSTTSLTTDVTNLDAYVNLVDGETGEIKATMQVSSIDTTCDRVTFKSTPDRTTVLNKTVVGAIPSTVNQDDFICLIHGSCVPFLKKPNSNFIIQHAVNDIKINKLGEPADALFRLVQKLEEQVERSWVGREQSLRVKGRNHNWVRTARRQWRTQR